MNRTLYFPFYGLLFFEFAYADLLQGQLPVWEFDRQLWGDEI